MVENSKNARFITSSGGNSCVECTTKGGTWRPQIFKEKNVRKPTEINLVWTQPKGTG